MQVRNKQLGFTLIEIMMVLAIAGLLTVIIISRYGSTRQRTQFSDAIERLLTNIEKTKTEVNSSFTTGDGTVQNRVFFGKALLFDDDSSNVEVRTYTAERTEDGSLQNVAEEETKRTSFTVPWGVKCSGADCGRAIMFTRQQPDGLLNTYIMAQGDLADGSKYTSAVDTAELNLLFVSPENLQATLTVSGASSEVKRSYHD